MVNNLPYINVAWSLNGANTLHVHANAKLTMKILFTFNKFQIVDYYCCWNFTRKASKYNLSSLFLISNICYQILRLRATVSNSYVRIVKHSLFLQLSVVMCFSYQQRLSRELSALSKQLAATAKELEAETMKRVDFENRNKTLQESITFQTQVHRKVRFSLIYWLIEFIVCIKLHDQKRWKRYIK